MGDDLNLSQVPTWLVSIIVGLALIIIPSGLGVWVTSVVAQELKEHAQKPHTASVTMATDNQKAIMQQQLNSQTKLSTITTTQAKYGVEIEYIKAAVDATNAKQDAMNVKLDRLLQVMTQ